MLNMSEVKYCMAPTPYHMIQTLFEGEIFQNALYDNQHNAAVASGKQ